MGVAASFRVVFALGLGLAACTRSEPEPERVATDQQALVWNAGDDLEEGRCSHSMALLGRGRALVCGGIASLPAVVYRSSCEVFSGPGTGTFAGTESLSQPKTLFTLTRMGDGDVIAVGGINASPLGDVQRYSAEDGAWTALSAASLETPRWLHASVLLPNGALLITGGMAQRGDSGLSAQVDEILPGAAGAQTLQIPGVRRQSHTATLLPSGKRVLVVGGTRTAAGETEDAATWRIFDIATSEWLGEQPLPGGGRSSHTATVLGSDVIVVGGRRYRGNNEYDHLASALRFRETAAPPYGQWFDDAGPLALGRAYHTAEVLHGRLLVIGGFNVHDSQENEGALDSVEVYDAAERAWFPLEPMAVGRRAHTSAVLSEGRLLVTGGCTSTGDEIAATEILTPLPQGESCEPASNACVTGHCVDGKCCDRTCEGSCRSCETGTCQARTGDSVEGREPCPDGFRCDAGECRTDCGRDSDCQEGFYCASDRRCVAQADLGAECSDSRECLGERPCVDGVCCERLCQECESCVPVTGACKTFVGDTPRERAELEPCAPVGTECGKRCDGVHPTCQFADEATACGTNACVGGTNQTGVCDGAGSCAQKANACAPFVCDSAGAACVERCADYRDCELGYVCENGDCVVNDASRCRDASECGSGNCVDGYCCEGACDGQCEACDVTGREGICVFVVGAPHGRRPVCAGAAGECGAQCDGTRADACSHPSGTECGTGESGCEGSVLVSAGLCDGAGTCEAPEPRDCAPGVCADAACKLVCEKDADCASDAVCEDGACAFRDHCLGTTTAFSAELGAEQCLEGFRCVKETGRCATECTSSTLHCDLGHSCDEERKRCVLPADTSDSSDGGCGCRVGAREGAPRPPWLLAALGGAAVLRRRWRARGRLTCNRTAW